MSLESLELIPRSGTKGGTVLVGVILSLTVHTTIVALIATQYLRGSQEVVQTPIRYVELSSSLPRQTPQHLEAPGPEAPSAPQTAPLSNLNRRASTPSPTGERPTTRPGDGSGLYTPPSPAAAASREAAPARQQAATSAGERSTAGSETASAADARRLADAFQVPKPAAAAEGSGIDWRSAIREAGKVASLGIPGAAASGGEEGFAESGPLSFETQWYPWGDYADSMVRKIRFHWYENMPPLIRMGMKGMVAIQFTIQRSGAITDVTIIRSSGIPPYDNAAKRAIELSSPLAALPRDFPNASERVTCQFYYNMTPPPR
jgi:TonB family protein